MRRLVFPALIALAGLASAGCDQEVTGSAPAIGENLPVTDPSFLCNDDPGTWVTLFGDDFSPLVIDTIAREEDPDVELPTLTLTLRAAPDGAEAGEDFAITLDSPLGSDDGSIRWIDSQTLEFRISSDLNLPAGVYDLLVENPNGETSFKPEAFGLIPRPTLLSAIPEMTCVAQGSRDISLDGSDFLILGDAYPTVRLGDQEVEVVEVSGCIDLHAVYGGHELCEGAVVRIAEDSLEPGTYPVTVENADPAACTSQEEVNVQIVPEPAITAIEPQVVCNTDGSVTFDVFGDDLYQVGGIAPQIRIGDELYDTAGQGCSPVDGVSNVQLCPSLEFSLDPSALEGLTSMVAINPDPIGCESLPSEPFFAAGAPQIFTASPDGICEDAAFDGEIVLFGEFLFETGGDLPEVSINGQSLAIDRQDFQDCEAIDFADTSLQSCGEIHISIDTGMGGDAYDILVVGTGPLACGEDSFRIERQPRPVVTSVVPERICSAGGTLVIQGSDFSENATVSLDGQLAAQVEVNDSGTSATATFAGPLTGNLVTLEFINPGGCGSTFETEIRIYDGPQPIFVDPLVTFDGISTQITIYAAGLYGGSIEAVELIHPDGSLTQLEKLATDPDRPNIVQAIVPEGMLATVDPADFNDDENSADFGIRLIDDLACADQAEGLLTITGEVNVAIAAIEPPFGAQDLATGVTITAVDPLEDPDNEVQFEATPRVYLNPASTDDPDADTVAREIRSIQFLDEIELSGLVTAGLPVGTYDVIVVNPDRTVGVLEEAFEVTAERPPLVDVVSPGSWTNDQTALQVVLEGQNFRDDPTVEVFCRPSGSTETDEANLTQPNAISVESVVDDAVVIAVNTNNLGHLDVCYLRLTNADGTYGEYSPVTVTNPAGNFVEFQVANNFDTPRRAPTTFSGVASRAARYLYIIGGDDGDEANAFTHGEYAGLDRFGAPRTWRYLPYELPSGRSLAKGRRIGDFLYLVGGSDEGAASNEILRAQVLDPLDSPAIVNIDLLIADDLEELEDTVGLEAGTYYYRVAAVYGSNDPANPNGESLASEPQPLRLPIDDISVTISWEPPAMINHDIVAYRVYRSINPDDPYGDESLLAEVDGTTTTFTDDGSEAPLAGSTPLPLGAHGMWHTIAALQHPRARAGVTSSVNPSDPDQFFLYAIGGQNADGSRADYEFITIDVNGPRDQQVTAQATIGQDNGADMLLPGARFNHQAVTADESNASVLAGVAPQVFVIAGSSPTDGDNNNYVATVGADGHLAQWSSVSTFTGASYAGHAAAAVNNAIIFMGGQNGGPSTQGFRTNIACGVNCPPAALTGWNNLGGIDMRARVWSGSVIFRGFFYLTGGLGDDNAPTNTIDYSPAGGAP